MLLESSLSSLVKPSWSRPSTYAKTAVSSETITLCWLSIVLNRSAESVRSVTMPEPVIDKANPSQWPVSFDLPFSSARSKRNASGVASLFHLTKKAKASSFVITIAGIARLSVDQGHKKCLMETQYDGGAMVDKRLGFVESCRTRFEN